jgi:hypothetical protein
VSNQINIPTGEIAGEEGEGSHRQVKQRASGITAAYVEVMMAARWRRPSLLAAGVDVPGLPMR